MTPLRGPSAAMWSRVLAELVTVMVSLGWLALLQACGSVLAERSDHYADRVEDIIAGLDRRAALQVSLAHASSEVIAWGCKAGAAGDIEARAQARLNRNDYEAAEALFYCAFGAYDAQDQNFGMARAALAIGWLQLQRRAYEEAKQSFRVACWLAPQRVGPEAVCEDYEARWSAGATLDERPRRGMFSFR